MKQISFYFLKIVLNLCLVGAAARAGLKTTIIEKPIKDILNIQLPVILLYQMKIVVFWTLLMKIEQKQRLFLLELMMS